MALWNLIRDCMREIEARNRIAFSDSAWQRFKELEQAIYALYRSWDQETIHHPDYGTWTKEEWEQFAAFMREHRGWE